MSNRDRRKAKRNKKKKVSHANKICPRCQSSLDKCGEHDHHYDWNRGDLYFNVMVFGITTEIPALPYVEKSLLTLVP